MSECAPSEENSDEPKDSFYEELEQVFDHLSRYHMKTLLEVSIRRYKLIRIQCLPSKLSTICGVAIK